MTTTFSTTSSFTRTHARYLASKIGADLRQMQLFYGQPSDDKIDDYMEEVVELLVGGYLDSVEYGFHRAWDWVIALRYIVRNGDLVTDDRSGRVTSGID